MPELPEVEAVTSGLSSLITPGSQVTAIELLSPRLRNPIPLTLKKNLLGQKLVSVKRRAKYILFEFQDWTLISHLGMTGSWRPFSQKYGAQKHDHFTITFGHLKLIYNDPRRFGVIDCSRNQFLQQNKWLAHLGVEPLTTAFSGPHLKEKAKNKKTSIKAFIMDQRHVVGVGNIYASEALHMAQIKPQRSVSRVTLAEWDRLTTAVQDVLRKSIASGGTTLKDFRQVSGEDGGFQTQLLVYDRAGESCQRCTVNAKKSTIRTAVIVGRSTYWCNHCQK